MPLEPGSLFGPYEILGPLGAGGMGEVYRARDRRLGRPVALKVLPERLNEDAESRGRLLGEARAASALDHPGIVTIFDVGSENGIDYVAMELVEGQPLSALIASGPLPISEVLRLGCAIGEALAAAHDRGVIHRDLKPANILLRPDGRPKILDFGLAKRLDALEPVAVEPLSDAPALSRGGAYELDAQDEDQPTLFIDSGRTQPGTLLGTPAYMAPEQARGEPVDHRSDLFALGGLLYELTAGQRPFGGRHTFEVLNAILMDPPQPLEALRADAPPELRRILEKALAKRPDDRHADARELVADLAALATPKTSSVRVRPRGWRAVAVSSLALLAVVAAVSWRLDIGGGKLRPQGFRLLAEESGQQPAFSPDGRTLAYTSLDASGIAQLFVRNLVGGPPSQLTRDTVNVASPTWSPKGDEIFYDRERQGIWAIPSAGGAARQLLERGSKPRISPDGRRLVYVNDSRIFTANVDGGRASPLSGVPQSFFGSAASAAFSPDARWIAVFQPEEYHPLGHIAILPAEGGEPRRLTTGRFEGGEVVFSPDGRFVIFSSNQGGSQNLWSVPVAGGPPMALTTGAGDDRSPQISPDGRLLVYSNTRARHLLARIDPRTGQRRELLDRRASIILPALSPDRRQVAFFSRSVDGIQVFTMSVEGGEPYQVTRSKDLATAPRWSSDGKELYYYNFPDDFSPSSRPSFRRIPAAGGESVEVVSDWTWNHQTAACLAPSGTKLAYSYRETRSVIEARVRDLATGAESPLERPIAWCQWSSDGQYVLGYVGFEVFLCPADGATCRSLTRGTEPRFAPDGQSVLAKRSLTLTSVEIWKASLDGRSESRVAELDDWNGLSSRFDILPSGELIWNSYVAEPPELWVADLEAP